MFTLENAPATILSVTPRAEHHGDELVPALTVRVSMTLENDVLTEFDGFLKGSLFKADENAETKTPGNLPLRKFPLMGVIPWGYKGVGYTAEITQSDDLFGRGPISLEKCTLDDFSIECLDNGLVKLAFKIGAHPQAADMGSLCQLLKHEVELTLIEPAADEVEGSGESRAAA